MAGSGRTLAALLLLLLLALLVSKFAKGVLVTLLVLAALLAIPVVAGAVWVWRVKRRMRKGMAELERMMRQHAAQSRTGPAVRGDVIDVEPTQVRDASADETR